jgi:enoyl-CoA hydratase/carnithine racemase
MALFQLDVRNGIAWVTFDSGGMNTLSQAAVADLKAVTAAIAKAHAATPLVGVILKGNKFGLGAGANIGELLTADRGALGAFVDVGHEALYAIE